MSTTRSHPITCAVWVMKKSGGVDEMKDLRGDSEVDGGGHGHEEC